MYNESVLKDVFDVYHNEVCTIYNKIHSYRNICIETTTLSKVTKMLKFHARLHFLINSQDIFGVLFRFLGSKRFIRVFFRKKFHYPSHLLDFEFKSI